MEAGAATGWVGTDWVEDLMLRTQTPEVYDEWLAAAKEGNYELANALTAPAATQTIQLAQSN